MQRANHKLETLYDTYSPMLYDIALQIAPTQKVAEQIIITTFTKAHKQKIEQQIYPSPCITLLKLLIQNSAHVLLLAYLINSIFVYVHFYRNRWW